MLALIDADIVCYRCAATAEADPEWVATSRTRDLVEQILHDVKAKEYQLFISGPDNFRYKIYPEYKANRKQPKPKHLKACEDYLVSEWNAEVTQGYEADDAMGIGQSKSLMAHEDKVVLDTIICSIDKDLLQVPGRHYNFVKKEMIEISPARGLREFYTSLLVGDAADNIRGKSGLGKVKAPRLLEGCETEEDLFNTCRDIYDNDEEMLLNGNLLWIWRSINMLWENTLYGQRLIKNVLQM